MARKIENSPRSFLDTAEFYDALASHYDQMTGFEQRLVKERPFFHLLINKHNISTALDAGCGTGFLSLLLARLGVKVTAVDVSKEMLGKLRQHASEMKLSVETVESTYQELSTAVTKTFDAIFCMGNSLAHLLSKEQLQRAIASFVSLLKPPGILFLQNLNYDRIMAQQEKVQSVKRAEESIFVRYYEYHENSIVFNILKLTNIDGNIEHRIQSTRLRPMLASEMVQLLSEIGIKKIEVYGSMGLEKFKQETSQDLVILAQKSS